MYIFPRLSLFLPFVSQQPHQSIIQTPPPTCHVPLATRNKPAATQQSSSQRMVGLTNVLKHKIVTVLSIEEVLEIARCKDKGATQYKREAESAGHGDDDAEVILVEMFGKYFIYILQTVLFHLNRAFRQASSTHFSSPTQKKKKKKLPHIFFCNQNTHPLSLSWSVILSASQPRLWSAATTGKWDTSSTTPSCILSVMRRSCFDWWV